MWSLIILFLFDSISCRGRRLESSIRDPVVALIVKILGEEKAEAEAVYRTLVGLGNLVCFFSYFHLQMIERVTGVRRSNSAAPSQPTAVRGDQEDHVVASTAIQRFEGAKCL